MLLRWYYQKYKTHSSQQVGAESIRTIRGADQAEDVVVVFPAVCKCHAKIGAVPKVLVAQRSVSRPCNSDLNTTLDETRAYVGRPIETENRCFAGSMVLVDVRAQQGLLLWCCKVYMVASRPLRDAATTVAKRLNA